MAASAGVGSHVAPSSVPTGSGASNALAAMSGHTLPSFSPKTTTSGGPLAITLPPALANQPWAQNIVHPSGLKPLTSYPNLNALEHPATVGPAGTVLPGYSAEPAPLGVADYGLGATPYAYNTSHFAGSVTFNAPPNETQPGATGVIEPGAETQGAVGNEFEFGVQLNTIGVNVTIPGTYDALTGDWNGYVWAQNVVNWNDTSIHFVQDTWNFSLSAGGGFNGFGAILSACNNGTAGTDLILEAYGGIIQCVQQNIPLTAPDYPVTLTLYNNFTTNSKNVTVLTYGFSLWEGGVSKSINQPLESVVFAGNLTGTGIQKVPRNPPGNIVDPFSIAPVFGPTSGLWNDAEMDIVGGIGGDNAVFTAINGSVSLQYSNQSSGGWKNVPSAYNFGSDTGETSYGIADFWTPSHTLEINQGPTMLYGLWNAVPHVSVASGDVQIAGTISPSYGFVFVSNTPPVLDPWSGTEQDNMSWLPASATGAFNTYLPPLGAPWTTTYYVQAFASGSAETNTTVTGSTTALAITLTAATGVFRAPLYMWSSTQAGALAKAVGAASTSAPYTFKNLVVNANFTFAHVNDYEYPDFEVFQSVGASTVVVNNVYIGSDSAVSGNSYIYDFPLGGQTGYFVPPVRAFTDVGYYTSGINLYYGTGDQALNQILEPIGSGGAQVTFWGDTNGLANDTLSIANTANGDSEPGMFVGDSWNTVVTNTDAIGGLYLGEFALSSVGVIDMSSHYTTVRTLFAAEFGIAVEAYGSWHGMYSWLNITDDSRGVLSGYDAGPGFSYYSVMGSGDLTVSQLNVTAASEGANITLSDPTTFNTVGVWDMTGDSLGIALDADNGVTINGLAATGSEGVYYWNVTGLTLNDPLISNDFIGVYGYFATNMVVTDANVVGTYGGFVLEDGSGFTGTNLNSSSDGYGATLFAYELDYYATGTVNINGVSSTDVNIGLNVDWTNNAKVTGVTAVDTDRIGPNPAGVDFYDSQGGTITNVAASDTAVGARLFTVGTPFATGNTVSDVVATGTGVTTLANSETVGVWIYESPGNTVKGVTATAGALGVYVDPTDGGTITGVTANNQSVGVEIYDSSWFTVTTVTASNESIGVYVDDSQWTTVSTATVTNESFATYSYDSDYTTVAGVTATNTTLTSPYSSTGNPFHLDGVAAVYSYEDYFDSITNIVATTYPLALLIYDSAEFGVSNVNATTGYYGVAVEDAYGGVFTGLGMYKDIIGFWIEDGDYNTITMSSFVDCSSFGSWSYYAEDAYFYDNNYIGNNGAGSTYNAAHIQAYSGYGGGYDTYYDFEGIGNYWSDWHTYTQYGNLAPYPLNDVNWDYYPLGGPVGTFGVWFYDYGLAGGTSWSVTFNGATQTTTNDWLAFYAMPGTYSFSAGTVPGYKVTPGSGSVTVSAGSQEVDLYYTAQYNVTITETGLPALTNWVATVGGTSVNGTTSSLMLPIGVGTYSFQIVPVPGYVASPSSGTITVTNGAYHLYVTFTPVTYLVTITESGLSSGTSWSATVTALAGGTPVQQSSTGTSMTFALANGTYTVSVGNVSGYSLSSTSFQLKVLGSPTGASVSYTPNTTTSVVSTSTFNTWLAVAIAIAVIALVIGLLAMFLRRRNANQQPAAQPWTPPPSQGGSGSGAGGSGSWSEGPPSGGSPPS